MNHPKEILSILTCILHEIPESAKTLHMNVQKVLSLREIHYLFKIKKCSIFLICTYKKHKLPKLKRDGIISYLFSLLIS